MKNVTTTLQTCKNGSQYRKILNLYNYWEVKYLTILADLLTTLEILCIYVELKIARCNRTSICEIV